MGRQNAQQLAAALPLDAEAIARQRLARGDASDLEREIGDAHQAAGLLVEMGDLEQPTLRLAAGMLARDAVKPALDAARQGDGVAFEAAGAR